MNNIKKKEFIKEVEQLINRYSIENDTNTPDFILAGFIASALDAFSHATTARTKWYRQPIGEIGPLDYSSLPADIKKFLFQNHTHRELPDGKDEIVFKEQDVLAIIKFSIISFLDWLKAKKYTSSNSTEERVDEFLNTK